MERVNRIPLLSAAIAGLGTAALLLVGNGMNPVWPWMWVAPLPVLLFAAASNSWRWVAAAAALSMFVGSLTMLYYLHFVLHAPIFAWLVPFSAASLLFASGVLMYRTLFRRGHVISAIVSLPAMWAVVEYLASLSPANGTAGSLAYTQLQFLPIAQLTSITGPWGITFVLLLFPCGLAAVTVLLAAGFPSQALRVGWVVVPTVAAALLYGYLRLNTPRPRDGIKVGLLATDSVELASGETFRSLIDSYGLQAERLARQGAQVLVLPEKVGILDAATVEAVDSTLQSISDRTGAVLVIGVVNALASDRLNEARIYTPHQGVATYTKQHLLAPVESGMIPGSAPTFISRFSSPIGLAICKDMDFVQPALNYGRSKTALVLDPAWDFAIDRRWHGQIATMRGIENGYSVAHAAKQGFLAVTDDRGRTLGEVRSDSAAFSSLLVRVPFHHDETYFTRFSTWFPWFSAVLLIASSSGFWKAAGRANVARPDRSAHIDLS